MTDLLEQHRWEIRNRAAHCSAYLGPIPYHMEMARRRFFVENVHRGQAQITGPDAHHLTRVLRVEAGQKYEVSDNEQAYLAEVETARKDFVSFRILEPLQAATPQVHLHLFAALIKFERFELIVEKATELGVARITPVETGRSEKGLVQAASKRITRWERIAREASEQSRRDRLPEIEPVVSFDEALRTDASYRYALEESDAPPILAAVPANRTIEDRVALLVGPEGGWTDRERSAIHGSAWKAVSLGKNILRAETAAIAGLSIFAALWDGYTAVNFEGETPSNLLK